MFLNPIVYATCILYMPIHYSISLHNHHHHHHHHHHTSSLHNHYILTPYNATGIPYSVHIRILTEAPLQVRD